MHFVTFIRVDFHKYVGKRSNGYAHTRGMGADLAKDRICEYALVAFFHKRVRRACEKKLCNATVPSPLRMYIRDAIHYGLSLIHI